MKKLKLLLVCTLSCLAITVSAENWTLTLSGGGSTQTSGDKDTVFNTEFSLGRTGNILLPVEAGVRQAFSYGDGDVVSTTKLFGDWTLFSLWRVEGFAGANFGASYWNTPLTWSVAPEAGLRFRVTESTHIVGRVECPYDLNPSKWRETLVYSLGVRVQF